VKLSTDAYEFLGVGGMFYTP